MRLLGFNISRRSQFEAVETKQTAAVAVFKDLPAPKHMDRDYRAFSKEAYQMNVVANKAINARASAASQVKWTVWNGETEVVAGPINDVLKRPNVMQTQAAYVQQLVGYWCISGNRYQERVAVGDTVKEIYNRRPDRMRIIPGQGGMPAFYQIDVGGRKHNWEVDQVTGDSDLLHEKMFHPLDDWYGMSPIEAGAYSIDVHNASMSLSKALLDNSARPSGALVYAPKDGDGSLSDDQFNRLKAQMEDQYQGSSNAGRPMLLDGGMEWRSMGLSPKDMDSLETRFASARDVCLALGVPPLVIGIPGDNTYANYKEARLAFWEDTVIPDCMEIAEGWTRLFGGDLVIKPDFDHVPAIAEKKRELWSAADASTDLTVNERRELKGYEPISGGDTLEDGEQEPPLTPDEAKALAYGVQGNVLPLREAK